MAGTDSSKRDANQHASTPPIPFAAAAAAAETSPPPSSASSGGASHAIGHDDVKPGSRIGKYQIVRLLGRGGMGAVFEALDVALHRKVALKILPREFSENDEALKRFIREARLAARLNHPNAVGVYDVGKKGTIYYIAMELVRGASGQELLETTARDWREATRWVADACRALSAAHAAGLIHRDIKPSNMLISGDSGAMKISDFGLAKPTEPGKNQLTLTQKDAFIGTPLFMSPEQCRNDRVDARSDIYSLGATYYTLLAGKPPYSEGTALQILFAHCSAPIPDVVESNPDVPDDCSRIVRKAMAKDPDARYQAADEMLDDLQRVLDGQPIQADPELSAMNALVPPAGAPLEGAPQPAPAFPWQSSMGLSRREQQWWTRGVVAAAVVLVFGAVLAVVLARSGGGSEEQSAPVARTDVAYAAPASAAPASVAPAPAPQPVEAMESPRPAAVPATQPTTTPPIESPRTEPEVPKADAPKAPAVEAAPKIETQPQQKPTIPEAAEDDGSSLPDTVANRPIRAYMAAKAWTMRAKKAQNKLGLQKGAQALILWHDFFAMSPHKEHVGPAAEAKQLAELLSPGIADRPRVTPAAGPPLPPKVGPPPEGEKPPVRPPPRRQK